MTPVTKSQVASVDVIVPCYRYGRYLEECVISVLSQSVQDVRVLIINDASPDNTAEIAARLMKQDSRVFYSEHSTNKGHIRTYNEGIEWADSKYLLLLSADDYLLPGALGRTVDLMEAHPEVGLTFGNAIEIDEVGCQQITDRVHCKSDNYIMSGPEFIKVSGARNIVPTPSAIVRTSLQKQLGGYRLELPHSGDMELWMRLAAYSSIGFVKAPQAVYRRHSSNMSLSYTTQSYLPDVEQRKAALDCFFEVCSGVIQNPERVRARLLRLLARDAVGFASEAFNEGKKELEAQLSVFALGISPYVRTSWAWTKLAFKRQMGLRAWRTLHHTAARMGLSQDKHTQSPAKLFAS